MLFSASILGSIWSSSPVRMPLTSLPLPASGGRARILLCFCDGLCNHLRIGAEPVGLLNEFAALDLEDLDPSAALMVGCSHLERRNQAAEVEVVDLLEALLDVLARKFLAAGRFEGVAHRLDMDGRPEDAAVVDHRVVHLLWRLLALRLVHRLDCLATGIVVAGSGKLQRAV